MVRYFGSMVIASLLLFPMLARSQSDLARLEGRVLDASGSAIPNAKISLADERTGWTDNATTDAEGHYLFMAVRSMECTLTVEADKFKRVIRRNVVLESPGTNVENFRLQPRTASGLLSIPEILGGLEGVAFCYFDENDVDRPGLCRKGAENPATNGTHPIGNDPKAALPV